jgi:hexosaminidase
MVALIPEPVRLELKQGTFVLDTNCIVVATEGASEVAEGFVRSLVPSLGIEYVVFSAPLERKYKTVWLRLDPALKSLGAEGYRLWVTPEKVEMAASEPAGLFYATQTLRQLMPTEVFSQTPVSGIQWTIPCVEIEDYPRFAWRGAMLDVCRHFMPKEFIFKYIDLLALHKCNTLHWHLTEDQGWRIEIKRYPRLTEVGAWRKGTVVEHADEESTYFKYDNIPHGGFYTQEDARAVVEYAKSRFIRVVPEIEMPGHSQAAIAAYPELGNTGKQLEVCKHWGIIEAVFNVEESTLRFLQDVLDEVIEIFPSPFIHIGGDEVPKKEWKHSPAAQKRIGELGLKNEEELQSYFIRRMDAFLAGRGRRLIGWDEILEGGLAPGAAVMSWRGEEGGITAANAGHDVVMAPYQYLYLNTQQISEDTHRKDGNFLALEKVYQYDPVPAAIDPARVQHILGAQAELWAESIEDPKRMEYMSFPRLCALAEVDWTPPEKKNYQDFQARLQTHLRRLDGLHVNYCMKSDGSLGT